MWSSEAMNSREIPAVTAPSSRHVPKVAQVNCDGRGRTTTSRITPAHARRSHAVPSDPMSSIRPIATAMPSWTEIIAVTAMTTPLRADAVLTRALEARSDESVPPSGGLRP